MIRMLIVALIVSGCTTTTRVVVPDDAWEQPYQVTEKSIDLGLAMVLGTVAITAYALSLAGQAIASSD